MKHFDMIKLRGGAPSVRSGTDEASGCAASASTYSRAPDVSWTTTHVPVLLQSSGPAVTSTPPYLRRLVALAFRAPVHVPVGGQRERIY